MFRMVLACLFLLAVPALVMAQAPGDVEIYQSHDMPMWQRFVLVFVVALLVVIVVQLMMLRSDITALLERVSGVSAGGPGAMRR